jgi:hypothetical protein
MSEEQTNFKVTDRRLFNPDGSPRDLPPDEKQPEAQTAPTVEPPAPAAPSAPESSTASAQARIDAAEGDLSSGAAVGDESEDLDAEIELPGSDDPASFVNFIMSIASNAAASLGMMEHPVTHKREVDLELGKHWIDILGMLREKTKGNLSPQEQQIIDGLLADLRMQYVSLTSSASAKAPGGFTGRDIIGG